MKRVTTIFSYVLVITMFAGGLVIFSGTKVFAQTSTIWSKEIDRSTNGQVFAQSIIQTLDDGIVILVQSYQFGPYVVCQLIKLDSSGNIQWNQTFSKDHNIVPSAFIQTNDGGFAITGFSTYESIGNHTRHIWFAKTDSQGNMQWAKYYGSELSISEARALVETNDGGYLIAGDYVNSTNSNGWDALVMKTDSAGNEEWTKTYGGVNDERFYSIVQTVDGGYTMAGIRGSDGGNIPHFWLAKADSHGGLQWNQTYQKSTTGGGDYAYSMIETSDGGYAIAGYTDGGYAKNYTQYGSFWLVKTDSNGNMQWNNPIGTWSRGAVQVIQTNDGGYALSGVADSETYVSPGNTFELAKTDSSGNLQWIYSGFEGIANVVCQTIDDAYVLAGGGSNIFVAKITSDYSIPEFSSWIILPLFLGSAFVIIVVKKKNRFGVIK